MGNDVTEYDIKINQYDLDHLNGGQPVFKAAGDDIRLVLRPRTTEADE